MSFEFTGGVPSYSSFSDSSLSYSSLSDSSLSVNEYDIYNGFSLGISSRIKIVKNFGIGIHANYMYFPEIVGVYGNEGVIIKGKDCELLFGFDFLLGPSFLLYNKGKFRVPITLGLRGFGMAVLMYVDVPPEYKPYSKGKPEAAIFSYNYGLGFSISAEIHFTKWFYMLGRIQGGFDFFYFSRSEVKVPTTSGTYTNIETDYGVCKMINLNPQIGFGIQF
jgi:hypothetical protein